MATLVFRNGQIVDIGSAKKEKVSPQSIPTQTRTPSITGDEKRDEIVRGAFALGRGLEAPLSAVNAISSFAGGPQIPKPTEKIQNYFGIQPEQLEPQGLVEGAVHKFAEGAPLAAATGGLSVLPTVAAGSAVGSALQQGGAPGWLQDVGQLATEIGTGRFSGRIPSVKAQQAKYYGKAAEALGEGERHVGSHLSDVVAKVKNSLGTEVSDKITTKVNHAIDTIEKNIIHGGFQKEKSYSPEAIREIRTKLYTLRKTSSPDVKPYLDKLTKGINEQLVLSSVQNPEYFKNLSKADQYTQIKNMRTTTKDLFDKIPDIPGLSWVTKGTRAVLGATIPKVEKTGRLLLKNETARQHYFDAVKGSITQDPELFLRGLSGLDSSVREQEFASEEKPQSKNNSSAAVIFRNGKIV